MRTPSATSFVAVLVMLFSSSEAREVPPTTAPAATSQPATMPSIAGDWRGAIHIGPTIIRVGVHFVSGFAGWTGTFDQPDQGILGLPLKEVTVAGEAVRFAIANVPGDPKFDGALVDGRITGKFTQGNVNATFELDPGVVAPPKRPQEPVPPLPYREIEVGIDVKAGVHLAGTLTIPAGDPPAGGWPAAVMITGSGPQDRDESLLGHRPFLVIADHLTRAGVAVLRCDDRGVGKSTGPMATSTTADFADDAAASVAFLRTRSEVKASAIGLIGHSEGGLVAPIVAARDPKIAFVVMLAGPGVNGADILSKQLGAIALASGVNKDSVARQVAIQKKLLAAVRAGDETVSHDEMVNLIVEQKGAPPANLAEKAEIQLAAFGAMATLKSPWMKYFLTLEPQDALRQVKAPVLALNGALDTQVDLDQNLAKVGEALKAGGNRDVTLKPMPGLNHLFQHARTGAPNEYAAIEETISPEVLKIIADWINARFAAGK